MTANSLPDSVFLISDLHLETSRPDLCQAFLHFLTTTASEASALYILGDFFNVWIGDDDTSPLNLEISQALLAYAARGTAVYLMHGNRDFLLGESFARACGAILIPDPFVLHHGGNAFLLSHGDALCTRDSEYQQFRAMVRNPQWQAAILAKSLDERRAFAVQARAQSISMSSNKAEDIMDVSPDAVVSLMQTHAVTTLIHGHTHRPAVHTLNLDNIAAKRVVLGDWGSLGWYVRIQDQTLELKSFPI